MFKKMMAMCIFMILILFLAGCGGGSGSKSENHKTKQGEEKVIDLTKMNSNAIYAEVYNMMIEPDDYEGKKVKIKGMFTPAQDMKTNENRFFCIIPDAAGCCQQGIEFVRKGDFTYPDDYPDENAEITVEGIFHTYKTNDNTGGKYCRIDNAVMEIAE